MLGLVGLSAPGCYEDVDLDKLGCPAYLTGENCNTCVDNPHLAAPGCTSCKPQFTGETCDQCAENPYLATPKCTECKPEFTGDTCDQWPFTQLAAGDYHTCGLKEDGSALCWGGNVHGQLNVPKP